MQGSVTLDGPQVNDPRAPEWEAVVKQHFDWWDIVAEREKEKRRTNDDTYRIWSCGLHAHIALYQAASCRSMGH